MNRKALALTLLALTIVFSVEVALSYTLLSNVFEGLIARVIIPEPPNITVLTNPPLPLTVRVEAPDEIVLEEHFIMNLTIDNPNNELVKARFYMNFTLVDAIPQNRTSYPIGYCFYNTFQYIELTENGYKEVDDLGYEHWGTDTTYTFITPGDSWPERYGILIPTGTNVYYIEFVLYTPCSSVIYKAWLTN